MQCKYCQSPNLAVIPTGPHLKLICADCLKFQQFISQKDFATLSAVQKVPIKLPLPKP